MMKPGPENARTYHALNLLSRKAWIWHARKRHQMIKVVTSQMSKSHRNVASQYGKRVRVQDIMYWRTSPLVSMIGCEMMRGIVERRPP